MASNCCLSLYLNVAGIRQGPGKMPLESWKSPGIFCNQESGNPATGTDNELFAYAHPIGGPEGITFLGCPSVCACVCMNMC